MHRDKGESIQEMAWAKKHLAKAVFAEIAAGAAIVVREQKAADGRKGPDGGKETISMLSL